MTGIKRKIFEILYDMKDVYDTMYHKYGLLNMITILAFCIVSLYLSVKRYYVYCIFTLFTVFLFELFQNRYTTGLRFLYLYFALVTTYSTVYTDSAGVLQLFMIYNGILVVENIFKVSDNDFGIAHRGSTLFLATFLILTITYIFVEPTMRFPTILFDTTALCSGENESKPILELYAKLKGGLQTPTLDLMVLGAKETLNVTCGLIAARGCFMASKFLIDYNSQVQKFIFKKSTILPNFLKHGLGAGYTGLFVASGVVGVGICGDIVGTYLNIYSCSYDPSGLKPDSIPPGNKYIPTLQDLAKEFFQKALNGKSPTEITEKPLDCTPGGNLPIEGGLTPPKFPEGVNLPEASENLSKDVKNVTENVENIPENVKNVKLKDPGNLLSKAFGKLKGSVKFEK